MKLNVRRDIIPDISHMICNVSTLFFMSISIRDEYGDILAFQSAEIIDIIPPPRENIPG